MTDIKDYMKKELPMIIIGNILFLLILSRVFVVGEPTDDTDMVHLLLTVLNSVSVSSFIYVFTMVLDGLLSNNTKVILLYLCFGDLPGKTIFTKIRIKNRDNRFEKEDALKIYKDIYTELDSKKTDDERKRFENKSWYNIYAGYREESMIFYSNRSYLMFRDIYISMLIMLVIYIALCFLKIFRFDIVYFIYLTVLIIANNIVARNKASRFVYNVIANDIAKKGGSSK